jgi:hypothetical protein
MPASQAGRHGFDPRRPLHGGIVSGFVALKGELGVGGRVRVRVLRLRFVAQLWPGVDCFDGPFRACGAA